MPRHEFDAAQKSGEPIDETTQALKREWRTQIDAVALAINIFSVILDNLLGPSDNRSVVLKTRERQADVQNFYFFGGAACTRKMEVYLRVHER